MSAETNIPEKQEARPGTEAEATRARRVFLPLTDIYEQGDVIIVEAEMPGVRPDAVDVSLENDELTIAGHAETPSIEGHELSYAEYEVGDYHRKFRISAVIDAGRIDASLKDGVLYVVLPKSKKAQPHKVKVKAG